jgi:hypothetical protein
VIGKAVDEMKDQARAEKQPRTVVPLTRRPQGVAIGRPSPVASGWPALIVILVVGCGVFAVTDSLAPESNWHAITDCLVVCLIFGAMGLWVRANRPALAQMGESASERIPLEIRYVASERHPVWRAETKARGRERLRLREIDRS